MRLRQEQEAAATAAQVEAIRAVNERDRVAFEQRVDARVDEMRAQIQEFLSNNEERNEPTAELCANDIEGFQIVVPPPRADLNRTLQFFWNHAIHNRIFA